MKNNLLLNFNGKIIPQQDLIVGVANRALRYGDGLFESIRMIDGKIRFAQAHFDRLYQGMLALKMNIHTSFDFSFFVSEINALAKKKYVNNILSFYKNRKTKYPEAKVWYRISNLYFSAISIFKPQIAMDIYCLYNANSVLDFTMGWGGRLIGACALNIPKYIGIDMNPNLKDPYNKMSHFLQKHSTTEIELYFQDALSVDYSKLDYDLVLTSPPYYNIETYGDDVKKTKEEWNNSFYKPIFEKTFQHLKTGGHYCINIPNEVYENVATKILGNPFTKIPLPKSKRTSNENYNEFIYVWKK
jgi:hypothetical protein